MSVPHSVSFCLNMMFALLDSTGAAFCCRARSCSLCHRPQVVRLWVYESERVLRDRLVTEADMLKFEEFKEAPVRKHFADLPLVRTFLLQGWVLGVGC